MSACGKPVLIVDDNSMVRSALRTFLEANADVKVCGEAADGDEAIAKAAQLRPQVVVMDLAMPNVNGFEAACAIKWLLPDALIVVFSLYSDGYRELMKQSSAVDLVVSKTEGGTGLLKALAPIVGSRRA